MSKAENGQEYVQTGKPSDTQISRRFTIAVVGILMFVYVLTGWGLFQSKKRYQRQAEISAENLTQVLAINTKGILDKLATGLFAIRCETARQLSHGGIDNNLLNAYITAQKAQLADFEGLWVADEKGAIRWGTELPVGKPVNIADREYFHKLIESKESKPVISKPVMGRITKAWSILIADKVNTTDGSMCGVVLGSLRTVDYFTTMFSMVDVGKEGSIELRDDELGLIDRSPLPKDVDKEIGTKKVMPKTREMFNSNPLSATYTAVDIQDNVKKIVSYRKVEDYPLYVMASQSFSGIFEPWRREVTITLSLLILLSLGVLLSIRLFNLRTVETLAARELAARRDALELDAIVRESEMAERRKAEEKFELAFQASPSIITITRISDGRFVEVNNAFVTITGYSYEEAIGHTAIELNLWPYSDERERIMLLVAANGCLRNEDLHFKTKDGTIRTCRYSADVIELEGSKCTLAVIEDITERKKAEEQLKLLSATIEAASDGAYWMDSEGRFLYSNLSGCESLGYTHDELLQLRIFDINPRVDVKRWATLWENIKVQKTFISESIHRRKDGSEFPIEISSTYLNFGDKEYVNGFARDITERKRMEEELLIAQKLDSLGILAGGIAHDFNNLLGGIYGYIDMAGTGSKDEKLSRYLFKAMNTIERARGLTLQLLTFAKGGAPIKKIGNLFPHVQETAQFALSGSNVSCTFAIPPDIAPCDFDKNQIGQVIDNIVINAKQAMPDGGTIALTAENIKVSENEHPPLTIGDYVRISIKDSGVGMPKEMQPRIFDPFYTTKATGHGLGLASCYSIVKRHGGCIEVESEPGNGSTFHLYLPASKDSISSSAEAFKSPHTGVGTFLVMDDEKVMQETFQDMLEAFGYTVLCTKDGREAIDFLSSELTSGRVVAGMFFDLTIPGGMGGKETIGEIRKINPRAPVFVTSGYAEDPIMANPTDYGFTASICKPFRKTELSEILNRYMRPKK